MELRYEENEFSNRALPCFATYSIRFTLRLIVQINKTCQLNMK